MGAESESVLRCLGSKRVGEAMGDFFLVHGESVHRFFVSLFAYVWANKQGKPGNWIIFLEGCFNGDIDK